jgi:hypothetical protein
VVFLKEIVPKRAITFIANTVYGEKYATHAMGHHWKDSAGNLEVEYRWKVGNHWNFMNAIALREAMVIEEDTIESFITEHYWGFTQMRANKTGVYEVAHPKWKVHPVTSFAVACQF